MEVFGIVGMTFGMLGFILALEALNRISNLKKKLQEVAKSEARSISQTCEIFLRLGVEGYEKEGSKFFQRFLSRQKKEDLSE